MTDELLKKLEDAGAKASDSELSKVAQLMAVQIEREGELSKLEAQVKAAKALLDDVRDTLLPDAMKAAKCKLYVDDQGRKLELKDEMTISIPKKRTGEIVEKLRTWGYGDLVVNVLTCAIDKGQDDKAGKMIEAADKIGLTMERSETVNSGSVKKILKDKRKEGKEEIDLTFFGAFEVTRAKITE